MAGLVAVTVATGRGVFFGVASGQGPTVMLLHGAGANATVWTPVMARLSRWYRVVALDQRGHGRTGMMGADPQDEAAWDADAYAEDLLAVVDALDTGPVVVVGHWLGARNALWAASAAPANIAGVVAIECTPYIDEEVLDDLQWRISLGSGPFARRSALDTYLASRYPDLPSEALARRAEHGYRLEGGEFVARANPEAMTMTYRGLRSDLAPVLADLAVPVVLVRGRHSAVIGESAWSRTLALRPRIEAYQIPEAGHDVCEQRPDAVADVIRRFAGQVTAGEERSSERRRFRR